MAYKPRGGKGYSPKKPAPKPVVAPRSGYSQAIAARPKATVTNTRGGKGFQGRTAINTTPQPVNLLEIAQQYISQLNQVRRTQTPRGGKGYQGQTVLNQSYPLMTPTGTPHETGVSQPSLSARHGWHQQVMLQNIRPGGVLNQLPEAQGTAAPPPTPYTTTPDETGYGGYGGYDYGNGGGGGYTYPATPFSQYRQGYAMSGVPTPAAPTLRTAGQASPYQNYATQGADQRWISMLTNWRI